MSIEAMKQALEAFEDIASWYDHDRSVGSLANSMYEAKCFATVQATSLRQAIEQAEKQEPVAWRVSYPNEPEFGFWFAESIGGEGCLNEPLYTTPQPQREWIGLTDEEANQLWESTDSDWELMKRTEAKLKIKNGF